MGRGNTGERKLSVLLQHKITECFNYRESERGGERESERDTTTTVLTHHITTTQHYIHKTTLNHHSHLHKLHLPTLINY